MPRIWYKPPRLKISVVSCHFFMIKSLYKWGKKAELCILYIHAHVCTHLSLPGSGFYYLSFPSISNILPARSCEGRKTRRKPPSTRVEMNSLQSCNTHPQLMNQTCLIFRMRGHIKRSQKARISTRLSTKPEQKATDVSLLIYSIRIFSS